MFNLEDKVGGQSKLSQRPMSGGGDTFILRFSVVDGRERFFVSKSISR